MSNLTFIRENHEKYNTFTVKIFGASFNLEDCEILKIDDTEYGYQKATVKLSPEKVDVMKEIEEKVNEFLSKLNIS